MSIRVMSEVWRTKLPTSEKMVLLVIADHASDEGDNAWPSQQTIANRASLTIRTVQRCVNQLVADGWLKMDKGKGGSINCRDDRRPHLYRINLGKIRGDIVTGRKGRGDNNDANEATSATDTRRHLRPMNHSLEPSIDTSLFEEFWKIYPRKTAKGSARKAWEKIKDPESVMAGAQRFASDPNRDPSFTPHPATWLNGERWLDEPLPPRKLSLEETKARELVVAREKSEREREASRKAIEEEERNRQKSIPMPDYMKDILKRV